jgi:Ribonuclease G/E
LEIISGYAWLKILGFSRVGGQIALSHMPSGPYFGKKQRVGPQMMGPHPRVSRFGIIEMTRQRVRPSFESSNHVACSCCEGTGWVKSPTSAGIEILRRLRGELGQRQKKTCEITTGPDVIKYLCTDRGKILANFEKDYNKKIVVKNDPKFGSDKYTIRYK